jgi:hypothetical protein
MSLANPHSANSEMIRIKGRRRFLGIMGDLGILSIEGIRFKI